MEFDFDPNKAHLNQRKHGVSFAHAELALRDEIPVTIETRTPSASSASLPWALTHWVGCLSWSTPSAATGLVISARKASPGESEQYHA